jgi:hypothetical protein
MNSFAERLGGSAEKTLRLSECWNGLSGHHGVRPLNNIGARIVDVSQRNIMKLIQSFSKAFEFFGWNEPLKSRSEFVAGIRERQQHLLRVIGVQNSNQIGIGEWKKFIQRPQRATVSRERQDVSVSGSHAFAKREVGGLGVHVGGMTRAERLVLVR